MVIKNKLLGQCQIIEVLLTGYCPWNKYAKQKLHSHSLSVGHGIAAVQLKRVQIHSLSVDHG